MASKLLGACLIVLGVINILHEVTLRAEKIRQPGLMYAAVTALLFSGGAALLWRSKLLQEELMAQKEKGSQNESCSL